MPIEVATRVFEAFIVDGETILNKILFRMLKYKRDKLLGMDERLIEYLRKDIVIDCIEVLTLDNLINY